jgi:hypothetical protein
MIQARVAMLQQIDPYVGKYYSMEWARKNVLRLDDKEIAEIDDQIESEQELRVAQAEQQGQIDGTQQGTAQQIMQQLVPPQPDPNAQAAQAGQAEQQDAAQQNAPQNNSQQDQTPAANNKVKQLKTGTWPN